MRTREKVAVAVQAAQPVTPSPMIGRRGGPAGAPPIPWRKYIFYLLGFPIRLPRAVDQWEWQEPPDWVRRAF
jgi:hypothetical protein